jgi:hypothetical protein
MTIAATRTSGPDLETAVAEALRELDRLLEVWVGVAAHQLAFNSTECERVRAAIHAVARTAHRDRTIGQAVFQVVYNGENRSRLEFRPVSPVFEEPDQPVHALKGFRERREGHFEVLAVVEPL